jgi:hypothetical protein
VAASFIPGTLAVKGLRLAQASRAAGAFRYAGFLPARAQETALREGMKLISSGTSSVYASISSAKRAALFAGVADNVLQAAAFETAAAVALYRSPTLQDEDLGDIAWDIAKGTMFGGAIGGAVEGLLTNKVFKNASKAVESRLRAVDTITAREKMGLGVGDEAFAVIDSVIDNLSKEMVSEIPFTYRVNGKTINEPLQLGGRMMQQAQETHKKALEFVQAKLAYAVPGDPTVGRGLAQSLVDQAKRMSAEGATPSQIKHEMGNLLWGLKKIEGPGSDEVNLAVDYFYLSPGQHMGQNLSAVLTQAKPGKQAQRFRVNGSWDNAKLGLLGQGDVPANRGDAWMLGYDAVLDPKTKRYEINPNSKVIQAISQKEFDDGLVARVYQPRTHTTMDDIVPYLADTATQNSPLRIAPGGVTAGKKAFTFNFTNSAVEDSVEASARMAWASQPGLRIKGQTINWDDFAVLNRMVEDPGSYDEFSTLLRMPDGRVLRIEDAAPMGLAEWTARNKVTKLAQLGDRDHREITAILGTEPQWVERVTAQADSSSVRFSEIQGTFRPLASFSERENLIMSYDKRISEGVDFLDGNMAYMHRVRESEERMSDAVRSVLSKEDADTLPDIVQAGAKTTDNAGAGPSALGFSNPEYGDSLRAGLQSTGQWLQNTALKTKRIAMDMIQPAAARIMANGDTQLGAVTAMARGSDVPLTLMGNRIVDLSFAEAVMKGAKETPTPKVDVLLNPDVAEFLGEYSRRHAKRVADNNLLKTAAGQVSRVRPEQLYVPPIDTRKTPYFAFVRPKEGRMFGTDEVSMITARSPEELQQLADKVKRDFGGELDVLFKGDTEEYYKAKGLYDYNSGLNSSTIDSALKKAGVLTEFKPVMEPEAVIQQYVDFIGRSEEQVLRNAVSAKNAQLFSELDWLSNQYSKAEKSKFGYVSSFVGKTIDDPFGDYRRLALNVSKKAEFPIWHQANDFVDALGTRAYQTAERLMSAAKAGKTTWEDANKELRALGLPGPFDSQADYLQSQLKGSGNLIRTAVAKANTLLATVGLRLDSANALVNILSSPIMQASEISALRHSLRNDPDLLQKLTGMMEVSNPQTGMKLQSIGKLYSGAVSSFFGANKAELIKRYTAIGAIRDDVQLFHAMLEDLALLPSLKDAGKLGALVDGAIEKGAKFTGNNFAEQFTRFVSADMMRQLTDPAVQAGRMSAKEQDTFIRIFVNRTQGNYVASQRPILFQGTIGAAISLFQTYSFNLYQQLFKHIENRDLRTIAIMGGMQSSLFGLNGLPLFDAINTHLIGSAHINEGHRDAYSVATQALGKEMGDWAMYGSLSAMPLFGDKFPALYTRGDLNPRHLTILPTSFADIPAVSVGTRVLEAVQGFGAQTAAGNTVGDSFLHALEHNGMSRPLAGLAQILQGESTTSKGALIAAHQDLFSVASAARIMGAKPIDEAVALNTRFRMEAYKAVDRDRVEKLGVAVKQRIRAGNLTEEDVLEFAAEYAARGGRMESYNAAWRRWTKDANQSIINTMLNAHKTTYGQRLSEVMGGDPLDDYVNSTGEGQ